MLTFPILDIPVLNILAILKKMDYRRAARMRRTCHEIDDLLHRNADNFNLQIENWDTFGLMIRNDYPIRGLRTRKMFLCSPTFNKTSPDKRDTWGTHFWKHIYLVEGGRFDILSVTMNNPVINPIPAPIIEFIKTNKFKCRELSFPSGHIEEMDVVALFKASGASKLSIDHSFLGLGGVSYAPFPFEATRQLSTAGCRELKLEVSSFLESDYVEVFSLFESVKIESIDQDSSPSIASLIKLMIIDSNVPLRSFRIPIYNMTNDNFLSESEMADLLLEAECLEFGYSNCFVLSTPTDFILVAELDDRDNSKWCVCKRIPQTTVDDLVIEWFNFYILNRIPYDFSGLYECIVNNSKDPSFFGDYMEFLIDNTCLYNDNHDDDD